MKTGCERGGIVGVEVVVDVVPVDVGLAVVPEEVPDAEVAVGIPLRLSCVPSKTPPIKVTVYHL